MRSWRSANLLLAFLIELAMLTAFAYAGWHLPHVLWQRIALAILLPAIAIVLWGMFAAPRAGKRRLKLPALLYFKIAMFALAALAWWVAGEAFIGSIFAVLAAINLIAASLFRQV